MNPEQKAAASSGAAHIVVAAGPGAGKTKTLVARVNHLLASGTRPRDIVVITYTNAAAAEIVKRLDGATIGFCGTLHGFMLRQLRQFGCYIGLPPELSVVSEQQREEILAEVVAEIGFKGSAKSALEAIKCNPLLNRKGPPGLPKLMLLAASYHRRMLENGLLDFDSILQYGRAVLDAAPSVATHLLVDEFQDASDADDDIYSALRIANKFFVGDPDQAIYGFRGGNPANFMRRSAMPGTSLFYLEKNYRCGVQICAAANRLILHNKDRLPKQTVPLHIHDSSTVETMRCKDEAAELARLTQAIMGEPSLNVAVLCRTNALATRIAAHLEGCGVPVARKAARNDPMDWPAVRQYIALLCNPDNDLLAYAWLKMVAGEDFAKAARQRALAALTTINRSGDYWHTPTLDGLPDALAAQTGGWQEEIDRVKRAIADLPAGSTLPDLALALAAGDNTNDEVGEGVTVTTLHSAKGREWDSVYLPGWVKNLMPSKRGDEAEERRLAFVGITRARQRLVILWPAEVRDPWTYADSETEPSCFMAEAGF